MKKFKIYLSSDHWELMDERTAIYEIIMRNPDFQLIQKNEFMYDFGLNEYKNDIIADCDIFILILGSTYNKLVEEEYDSAMARQENGKGPYIFRMIKDTPVEISSLDPNSLTYLLNFKKKLQEYHLTKFTNTDSLKLYLLSYLYKLSEEKYETKKTKKLNEELNDIRVFISYNHNDSVEALKIKNKLVDLGVKVIIDSESLTLGGDIQAFIKESILNSNITLSIISRSSLLSSWVTMETIETFNKETDSKIKFLPVLLDNSFFDRKFTGEAIEIIDLQINEIVEILKDRFEKKTGFADLYGEFKRYLTLRNNIDEIIRRLRESLVVDVSQQRFDDGMKTVIEYLTKLRTKNNEA